MVRTDRRRSGSGGFRKVRLAADVDHAAAGLEEAGLADVVAGFLLRDDVANVAGEVIVRTTAVEHAVEIVVGLGKEAGADLAVRGEPDAAAGAAEGAGDRRNDADLTDTVVEGEALRRFAGRIAG